MALRFRRSIKIAPGVKLNINKGGISTSIGVKGAHVTYGSNGKRRTTLGIPGSGVSSTTVSPPEKTSGSEGAKPSRSIYRNPLFWVACFILFGLFIRVLSPH